MTMPAASADGVKRGKLYPEQGQIGGRNPDCRGRGALPSPRVGRTSRWVTVGLRWMAIPVVASAIAGQNSAYRSPRWHTCAADSTRRDAARPGRRGRADESINPRPVGRYVRPCNCCRRPWPHRDHRWESGPFDPERDIRRRTRVPGARRPESSGERCIVECDAGPAGMDPGPALR